MVFPLLFEIFSSATLDQYGKESLAGDAAKAGW